jgi:hypothetical protein
MRRSVSRQEKGGEAKKRRERKLIREVLPTEKGEDFTGGEK